MVSVNVEWPAMSMVMAFHLLALLFGNIKSPFLFDHLFSLPDHKRKINKNEIDAPCQPNRQYITKYTFKQFITVKRGYPYPINSQESVDVVVLDQLW